MASKPPEPNYLIFSDAGKLIYTRLDTNSLHMAGIIQAIIAKSLLDGNKLEYFKTSSKLFVIYTNLYLNYVSITNHNNDVEIALNELKSLESQIIMTLTKTQLKRIFEDQPNYDLRGLLAGTEVIIEHLAKNFKQLEWKMSCVSLQEMPRFQRQMLQSELSKTPKSCLFSILFNRKRVYSSSKQLDPKDVLLLQNMMFSSTTFQAIQSWFPICLPQYNPNKFLHCYSSFITSNVCLVLLSLDNNAFYELSQFQTKLKSKLESIQFNTGYSSIPFVNGMTRFVCKYNSKYLIESNLIQPYTNPSNLINLNNKFKSISKDSQFSIIADDDEIVVVKKTGNLELYCAFGPMFEIGTIETCCNELQSSIEKSLGLYI